MISISLIILLDFWMYMCCDIILQCYVNHYIFDGDSHSNVILWFYNFDAVFARSVLIVFLMGEW